MDQDAFRNLLAGSRQSQPGAEQGAIQTAANSIPRKATAPVSSEPAFKPRKVKKVEGKYRDRAAERRGGTGNDYAHVEAVLEDFEKRATHGDKDIIEQQRKYLGGDSEHTILVKGLDMSLVEQNRARAAASTEDDEILEQAFVQVTSTSHPTELRKRTREDIIRDLKAKRQNRDGLSDQSVVEKPVKDNGSILEASKKAGKFRPIGFKPIGQTEEKSKKRKIKKDRESVKKQKVESTPVQSETTDIPAEEIVTEPQERDTTEVSSFTALKMALETEPTLADEDFDIFADAGYYEGLPEDEESDVEHRVVKEAKVIQETTPSVPIVGSKGWFDEPGPEVKQTASTPPEEPEPTRGSMETEEKAARLRPLESSTLPSIRDFLAMDEAAEKAEKRKARKEKKKKKRKEAGDDDDD